MALIIVIGINLWWHSFVGAQDLYFFIQTALENNLSISSQRLSIQKAEISFKKAKKEKLLPEIMLDITQGQTKETRWIQDEEGKQIKEKTTTRKKPTLNLAVSILRHHLLGGKIESNLKTYISKDKQLLEFSIELEEPISSFQRELIKKTLWDEEDQLKIANLSLQDKINELIYNIVTTFYDLQRQYLALELKMMELQNTEDNLEILHLKLKKGIIPEIDILEMELQKSSLKIEIDRKEKEIQEKIRYFSFILLGTETNIEISKEKNLKGKIENLKEKLGDFGQKDLDQVLSKLKNTPKFKIKELETQALERKIKEAASKNLPVIIPSYTFSAEDKKKEQKFSLSFKIPLYDKGIKKEEIKLAKISYQQQELELKGWLLDAQINLKNTIQEIKIKEKTINIQKERINQAEKLYEVAKIKYERGLIHSKDLLEYQDELFRAKKELIELEIDLYLDYINLLNQTGELNNAYQENIL